MQFSIGDTPEAIAQDLAAISRISAVSAVLKVICNNTGMGFAAVARVTDHTWVACAVQDNINFGLKVGAHLDVKTDLCFESRAASASVVIDHFSEDPIYGGRPTPRIYGLESYISVPIVLPDGRYFGNLCAIDPRPRSVSDPRIVKMFEAFSQLIGLQLDNEEKQSVTDAALVSAHEASELREQFIAVLGHDLRNPLAAVGSTAEFLSLRKNEPDLLRLGQRLAATTLRMAHLIDDVMDFARGRLGAGIGVAITPADDLSQALRDVVSELREAHPARSIVGRIHVETTVFCDKGRIQQLLSNLVGNALTHGSLDHPVEVDAFIEGTNLVLAVRNGGDLISPENLQKVFEPYWRPATSVTGGGLGLGLFICKQIVKAHEGSLEVKSTMDQGTCFVARLPTHNRTN
jgi:signal transduction histidine kinase